MDITPANLRSIYTGLSTAFNVRFATTTTLYGLIATTVPSSTAANEYPRMDDLPGIREWVGDRVIHDLSAQTYIIRNREFEGTIGVRASQIEADQGHALGRAGGNRKLGGGDADDGPLEDADAGLRRIAVARGADRHPAGDVEVVGRGGHQRAPSARAFAVSANALGSIPICRMTARSESPATKSCAFGGAPVPS